MLFKSALILILIFSLFIKAIFTVYSTGRFFFFKYELECRGHSLKKKEANTFSILLFVYI